MYAELYPPELLEANICTMFSRLAAIACKYNIRIMIENEPISRLLRDGNLLVDMLTRYDQVKLCLDLGRLHLQEKIDPSFNALKFAETMAPYTCSIHLWNASLNHPPFGGHYPALPELTPADGWADIGALIEIIKESNCAVKVVFEHRSDLISDQDLNRCYGWIAGMLK
ncbi:MAG TPA: hypothetical protein VMW83_11300 [Spirochaetia bacterium]|nr:hypothetical protein [Spirochaetia bacterium]